MGNFGAGGLVPEATQRERKVCWVEIARLPHTHTPRKAKIAIAAAC